MSKKMIGIVLMVVGVVVVIVSLGADMMGLGATSGLGLWQALGTVLGVIIVAVGAWFWPGFPPSRLMANEAVSRSSQRPEASRSACNIERGARARRLRRSLAGRGARRPRATQGSQRSAESRMNRMRRAVRTSASAEFAHRSPNYEHQ